MRVVIFSANNHERDWRFLADEGFHLTRTDGRSARDRLLRAESFDLVIVEYDVNSNETYDDISWIRERDDVIPAVVSIGREYENEIIRTLGEGADDCICTRISNQECLARLQALLRRGHRPVVDSAVTLLYGYTFNRITFKVSIRDETVSLTEKEFDLAYFFFCNLGRVLSRDHISLAVWRRSVVGESRSLDTHMSRIRRKLHLYPENGFKLGSVYTRGYRLEYLGLTQDDANGIGDV